jgi:hypothetical protein
MRGDGARGPRNEHTGHPPAAHYQTAEIDEMPGHIRDRIFLSRSSVRTSQPLVRALEEP